MRMIYKYQLEHGTYDESELFLPKDAKLVLFGIQNNKFHLWAEVKTELPPISRKFQVVGTGWALPDDFAHIASMQDGPFVWHLYERTV